MKSQSFTGTILFTHPETDEVWAIDYEGVYAPAIVTSIVDTSHADESSLTILELPPELAEYEDKIKQECWDDFQEYGV